MTGSSKALPVTTVSLEDLKGSSLPFSVLEDAFGPSSLGIILVKDLPSEFIDLRLRLLSCASYLANLPPETLETLSCPEAKYLTGWSHGKEALRSGHYDTLKGSYYINCAFYQTHSPSSSDSQDTPNSTPSPSSSSFPEYTHPNIWPPTSLLPDFQSTFQDLCILIIDVAVLVARACDRYASAHIEDYKPGYLEHVVNTSRTTKARLLHYFPPSSNPTSTIHHNSTPSSPNPTDTTLETKKEDQDEDSWCTTHLDHGCLTGLTSALYIDETHLPSPPPLPLPTSSPSPSLPILPSLPSPPDPHTGLYIRSRTGTTTKVSIPPDCLAFQTGEALEVITRGKFRAVPHFVRGPASEASVASTSSGTSVNNEASPDRRTGTNGHGRTGIKIARNTLAVFTQPNLKEIVDREKGITFGDFARGVVERHTDTDTG